MKQARGQMCFLPLLNVVQLEIAATDDRVK